MLNRSDIPWLTGAIAGTAEAMGQVITPNAAALMASDLADYTKPQLAQALHAVRIEGKGRLSLNIILQQLDRICGRYGAEEAWALAVQAHDEAATVVWNNEVAQAWALVSGMAAAGDLIGARMAFKQAYERIGQEARNQRQRPQVQVSIGWDSAKRIEAVSKAHQQGLLALAEAQSILAGDGVELKEGQLVQLPPSGRGPAIGYTPDGTPVKLKSPTGVLGQLLIGHAAAPPVSAKVMQRLADVARKAAAKAPRRKAAMARLERMKLKRAQAAAQKATEDYLRQKGQKP